MSDTEKQNGFTTIRVSKTTHEYIGNLCPKSWDYDRFILEIAKAWEKQIGKPSKTNQDSRINT